MKPDRHEWLRAEQARIETEGTGSAFVRHALAEHAKRMLGFSLVVLPTMYLIGMLPRRIDGVTQPAPLFAAGVALTVIGFLLWKWWKPIAMVSRWATWTFCGAGVLFCLVAATI